MASVVPTPPPVNPTPSPQIIVAPPEKKPIWFSRRFITAVASLLIALLVTYLPDLGPYRDELYVLIAILAPTLIIGYSAEDVVKAREFGKLHLNVEDSLRQILESIIEERVISLPPQQPSASSEVTINLPKEEGGPPNSVG